MQALSAPDLLACYSQSKLQKLKFIIPLDKLGALICEHPHQPEGLQNIEHDPNDFFITHKSDHKNKHKEIIHVRQKKEHTGEERKKVYVAGPFALFYKMQEGELDKDKQVWYYKDQNKNVVGPASSYNMDKMVYFNKIQDTTKIAFKTCDKFVRFEKIKKATEGHKIQQ